jgi:hypothetical protein
MCKAASKSKTVITRNFFVPFRTLDMDMDMETTGAENTLPGKEAPRKASRPSQIMTTSTTNFIGLQSDLKDYVKGEYDFRNT